MAWTAANRAPRRLTPRDPLRAILSREQAEMLLEIDHIKTSVRRSGPFVSGIPRCPGPRLFAVLRREDAVTYRESILIGQIR